MTPHLPTMTSLSCLVMTFCKIHLPSLSYVADARNKVKLNEPGWKNEYHSISLLSVSAGKSPFVLRISTDQDPSSLIRFKMVHSSAYLIAAKICLLIGTIGVAGNTLSAIVIVKNWTKISSEVYLVALAACDNVYTLSTIFYATWYLGAPGIDCECALVFAFISTFWSAWIIVFISLERLLVTWYPRQKNAICHVEVGWALLMTVTISTLIFQFNMYGGMARLEMANSTVRTHRLDINRTHAVSCVGHMWWNHIHPMIHGLPIHAMHAI